MCTKIIVNSNKSWRISVMSFQYNRLKICFLLVNIFVPVFLTYTRLKPLKYLNHKYTSGTLIWGVLLLLQNLTSSGTGSRTQITLLNVTLFQLKLFSLAYHTTGRVWGCDYNTPDILWIRVPDVFSFNMFNRIKDHFYDQPIKS